MHLNDYLQQRLEPAAVSREALQELLIRLLNYGVLAREESITERELYDRFVRIEDLVGEVLTRDLPCGSTMPIIIGVDRLDREDGLVGGREREEPLSGGEEPPEAGILCDDRTTGGQIGRASITEPAAL